MSIPELAALVILAVSVGWYLRGAIRNPPEGTDPEYWVKSVKKWRGQ